MVREAGAKKVLFASAPESKVQEIISNLSIFFDAEIEEKGGVKENISFKLPPELRAS